MRLNASASVLFFASLATGGLHTMAGPGALASERGRREQPSTDVAALLERVRGLAAKVGADPANEPRRLDELIVARGHLIDAGAQDDRLPTWLLDQAETVLARVGMEGAASSVLLGVPTRSQCERVERAAAEADRLVRRADGLIDELVPRLEERIFGARDAKGAAEERVVTESEASLSRLIDSDRGVRMVLLRGMIIVLQHGVKPHDHAGAATDLDGAISSLSALRFEAGATASAGARQLEDVRRLTLAVALVQRGDASSLQRADELGAAMQREMGATTADARESGGGTPAVEGSWRRLEAECVRALSCVETSSIAAAQRDLASNIDRELRGVSPVTSDAARSSACAARALLGAECFARISMRALTRDGAAPMNAAARTALVNAATGPLVRTLAARSDDAWQKMVYEKVATVSVWGGEDLIERDAAPAVALSIALRRVEELSSAETAIAARSRRERALQSLRAVADRADAVDVRAGAQWEIAALLTRREADAGPLPASERDEAIDRLTDLLEHHTTFRAYRAAAEAAAALCLSDPSAPMSALNRVNEKRDEALKSAALERRIAALNVVVGISPRVENAGSCRLELARLLARRGVTEARGIEGADGGRDVVAAFEHLSHAGEAGEGSRDVGATAIKDGEALVQFVASPQALRRMPATVKRAVSDAASKWSASHSKEWSILAELPRLEADATDGATEQTVTALTELERWTKEARGGDANEALRAAASLAAARVQVALGRAQRRTGKTAAAFETLRRVTTELDRAPAAVEADPGSTGSARPVEFWCAWAELLEMLDAENASGDRTATMRLQLNRLRLIDANFGGAESGARLRAVAAKLG